MGEREREVREKGEGKWERERRGKKRESEVEREQPGERERMGKESKREREVGERE